MNFCPKCRSYYNDADLRFCFKDGVPLIAVGANENLRREGVDFIKRTEEKIKIESLRKQIRKIVTITITTILTVLIISVVTINSWIYLNPEPTERAKTEKIQPETKPSIQVSAQPNPIVETNRETVSTNSTSSEITTTPRVAACSPEEQKQAIAFIKNKYGSIWYKKLSDEAEAVQNEIAAANDLGFNEITVKLNFSPESISVRILPDCKNAEVTVKNPWTANANLPNVRIRMPRLSRGRPQSHRCDKNGSNWVCK